MRKRVAPRDGDHEGANAELPASHAAFSEQASPAASSRPSAKREACTAKHCWAYSAVDRICSSSYAPLNIPVTGDCGPLTIWPCTLTAFPFSVVR